MPKFMEEIIADFSTLCTGLAWDFDDFGVLSRCLLQLTTSYNQCLPCNQVLQSRWKICGQNSGTHRCTNERRQTNAAAKLHNSFATPLVVLRLSRKAEQQNRDPKDLVTPIIPNPYWLAKGSSNLWDFLTRHESF